MMSAFISPEWEGGSLEFQWCHSTNLAHGIIAGFHHTGHVLAEGCDGGATAHVGTRKRNMLIPTCFGLRQTNPPNRNSGLILTTLVH